MRGKVEVEKLKSHNNLLQAIVTRRQMASGTSRVRSLPVGDELEIIYNYNNMNKLLDRLISQLNTLIPFIAISNRDVFKLIQKEKKLWLHDNQDELPKTYEIYRKQIINSAFILGYSYLEAFLSDLARNIFLKRPQMLPSNKTIKFEDIVKTGSYDELLIKMIDKELFELFYKSIDEIVDYFSQKFGLSFSSEEKDKLLEASLLRNCIVHNLGIADARLAQLPGYTKGKEIKIDSYKVHDFGLVARQLARKICQEALEKHINNV